MYGKCFLYNLDAIGESDLSESMPRREPKLGPRSTRNYNSSLEPRTARLGQDSRHPEPVSARSRRSRTEPPNARGSLFGLAADQPTSLSSSLFCFLLLSLCLCFSFGRRSLFTCCTLPHLFRAHLCLSLSCLAGRQAKASRQRAEAKATATEEPQPQPQQQQSVGPDP